MKLFISVLIAILWVLIRTLSCSGQSHSLLGICHKDVNCQDLETLWQGQSPKVTGWLERTFGESCECADRFLKASGPKIIRVHFMNGPCMRNKRCGHYEAFWGYTAASANRAVHIDDSRLNKRFNRILERFKRRIEGKDVTCYVSPCLECDLNAKARKILLERVGRVVPQCMLVDNPHRQRCIPEYTCEGHGVNPVLSAPCIVDLDGIDGRAVDVKTWVAKYKHCDLQFYWESWMNCIQLLGKQFVDPRRRGCDIPPLTIKRAKERLCQSSSQSSDTCSR